MFIADRDQHAIIIGAGPAGSLAAMALARQGFQVDVFEKRPEPKLDHVSPDFTADIYTPET